MGRLVTWNKSVNKKKQKQGLAITEGKALPGTYLACLLLCAHGGVPHMWLQQIQLLNSRGRCVGWALIWLFSLCLSSLSRPCILIMDSLKLSYHNHIYTLLQEWVCCKNVLQVTSCTTDNYIQIILTFEFSLMTSTTCTKWLQHNIGLST